MKILTYLKNERNKQKKFADKFICKLALCQFYLDINGDLLISYPGETTKVVTTTDEEIKQLVNYFNSLVNYDSIEN